MPLSIESEIDLLYHLSRMSEHVLPKGMFYLLLWKRLNQSCTPPSFSFHEMIDHLRSLYDESVFDNPELPESQDHDFEWIPINAEQSTPPPPSLPPQPQQQQQQQQSEKDQSTKPEIAPTTPQSVIKTRKRPASPSSVTPNNDTNRRSSRQKPNTQTKDEEQQQQSKVEKRKSIKEPTRVSTRAIPANDSIGTRLRGQK